MRRLPLYFVLIVLLWSCGEDDETNAETFINNIELLSSNVDGLRIEKTIINTEDGVIQILPSMIIPSSIDTIKLNVNIVLSNGAELSSPLSNLWFGSYDDEILCTVIAENGDTKDWLIRLLGNQLPNSHFEDWYEVVGLDGNPYWEPGKNEFSIWSTINFGTSEYKLYGAIKFPEGNGTQVKILTQETNSIPILAGAIFTGDFVVNDTNNTSGIPKLTVDLGVPYILRPDSMRITYRYKPGEKLIKGTPIIRDSIFSEFSVEELRGIDECHIYAVLEQRSGDVISEIGRAEFSTSKVTLRVVTITIPFNYVSGSNPTHISFIATSSKQGADFQGAVGSTLNIDDLVLVYE